MAYPPPGQSISRAFQGEGSKRFVERLETERGRTGNMKDTLSRASFFTVRVMTRH